MIEQFLTLCAVYGLCYSIAKLRQYRKILPRERATYHIRRLNETDPITWRVILASIAWLVLTVL